MPSVGLALAGSAAVFFAGLMLFQKSLYSSAVCLLLVLMQVAVLFLLFGADVLGLMQVLIYAGAVMVMIVIAVMLAPPRLSGLWAAFRVRPLAAAEVVAALFLEFLALYWIGPYPEAGAAPFDPVQAAGLQREMASLLFGRYAVMTEAVGLLVLSAALAVVELSREAA